MANLNLFRNFERTQSNIWCSTLRTPGWKASVYLLSSSIITLWPPTLTSPEDATLLYKLRFCETTGDILDWISVFLIQK